MRVLLTGSSGWLGRFLAPMLRQAGHEVTGLDVAPGHDTDVIGSVAARRVVEDVFAECRIEAVIRGLFPDAAALYAARGWRLPASIGRVYDASLAERELGFRCRTDFAAVLGAMRAGAPLPFIDDPGHVSPKLAVGSQPGA